MGDMMRVKIRDANNLLASAERLFQEGFRAIAKARLRIAECEELALENSLDNLPLSDKPITEHRRKHRMGRVPKIDTDPELQAFIVARIDRMTYAEIAKAVADHFPEARRVRKTAIYDWAKRQNKG